MNDILGREFFFHKISTKIFENNSIPFISNDIIASKLDSFRNSQKEKKKTLKFLCRNSKFFQKNYSAIDWNYLVVRPEEGKF